MFDSLRPSISNKGVVRQINPFLSYSRMKTCFHLKIIHTTGVRLWIFLMILGGCATAWAQTYEKANQILDGQIKIQTVLKAFPDGQSASIEDLQTNQTVLIMGRQDNWFDVQTANQRGWVSSFYVDVVGVSSNQKVKPIKMPKASFRKVRNETDEAFFNKLRIVPFASYSLEGKSFYDQIRLGLYATLKTSDLFSVGLLTEAIFINGSYFAIGPTFHRIIHASPEWLNPSLQWSVLYYSFDHATDKDSGYGIQWALENDFMLIERPKFVIKPVLRTGMDVMLFNFDELRVPFFFSLGTSLQF